MNGGSINTFHGSPFLGNACNKYTLKVENGLLSKWVIVLCGLG